MLGPESACFSLPPLPYAFSLSKQRDVRVTLGLPPPSLVLPPDGTHSLQRAGGIHSSLVGWPPLGVGRGHGEEELAAQNGDRVTPGQVQAFLALDLCSRPWSAVLPISFVFVFSTHVACETQSVRKRPTDKYFDNKEQKVRTRVK